MSSNQLVDSALAGAQTWVGLTVAVALFAFYRVYDRTYLLHWARNTAALCVFRIGSVLRDDIPVILMTGHTEALTSDRSAPVRVATVLTKPFELQELADAVNRALGMVAR